MLNVLKKIARQPLLVKVSDGLRIRGTLRAIYRYCFAPGRGRLSLTVGGRQVRFYVYSRAAVMALDSLGGERQMLEYLMGKLNPGDCFYDIGAATGLYAVFLGKVVGEKGKGVCFEPELDPYERLRENLKLNKLAHVRPFPVALGDREQTATLMIGNVAGAGRIISDVESSVPQHMQQIQVVQGDRFIESHGLPFPRAIKIDVEGKEYAVLQGLTHTLSEPTCQIVCCEIHPQYLPPSAKPEDVLALLRSKGFSDIQIHNRTGDLHACASKPI
jgi:FkbM family methyltransferase